MAMWGEEPPQYSNCILLLFQYYVELKYDQNTFVLLFF